MRGVLLAAAMIAGLGCSKVCDEDALLEAAQRLDDRSVGAKREAVDAVLRGCPTMPKTLAMRFKLDAEIGKEELFFFPAPSEDSAYVSLYRETCPMTDPEVERYQTERRTATLLRELCKLDRFELLEPDELFVRSDIVPFLFYVWAKKGRVSEPLVRRLARGLLAVSDPPGGLEVRCFEDSDGCDPLLESWGVQLPRSQQFSELEPGPKIRVTTSNVWIRDEAITPSFTKHVAPALQGKLPPPEADHRLNLFVDRGVSYSTLVDVMFTARRAGHKEFSLGTRRLGSVYTLPVEAPEFWDPPSEARHVEDFAPILTVHRDSIDVNARGATRTFATVDESFAEYLHAYKNHFPNESTAIYRVDADVDLQRLVDVIDGARGADCRSYNEGCVYPNSALDANPPLYWNVGIADTFALGDGTVKDAPRQSRNARRAAQRFEASRDSLRDCLVKDTSFLRTVASGSTLSIIWASMPGEQLAYVLGPDGVIESPARECMLEAFDAKGMSRLPFRERPYSIALTFSIRLKIGGTE